MLQRTIFKYTTRRDTERVVYDSALEIACGEKLVASKDPRLPAIYDLYREAMGMSTPPDTRRFVDTLARSTAILAPDEDHLAGICLWQSIQKQKIGKIHALAVERDRHRSGIGSEMMSAALRGMEDRGLQDVTVDALVTPQAIGFYEKHGFARLSYDAPGARPDVPMQRSLG